MKPEVRRPAARVLVVLGGVALLAAMVAFWGNVALLDSDGFTDRATEALGEPAVRDAMATRLVDQVIAHGSAELITVRPLLEVVVGKVVESRPFIAMYRPAVRELHASIFGDDDALVLKLVDFMIVVSAAIESFDHELAARLPQLRATLIELRRRDMAAEVVAASGNVRFFAWVAPLGALMLFGAAFAVSTSRQRTAAQIGVAMAAVGATLVVGLGAARAVVLGTVNAPLEAEALGGLWRVFVGSLARWGVALGVVGTMLAASATSAFESVDVRSHFGLVRRAFSWSPQSRTGQVVRAVVILMGAWVLLSWPAQLVDGLIVLVGLYALYAGLIELIRATGLAPAADAAGTTPVSAGRFLTRVGARGARYAGVVIILTILMVNAVPLLQDVDTAALPVVGGSIEACNGSLELCDRTLDQVAFPTTHNSMSAASESGWFFASHDGGIRDQLEFGIRGFLFDTYYGLPVTHGVRTDLFHGDPREALVERYGEEMVAARDRIAEQLGDAGHGSKRGMYLCHGFCELGATLMADALRDMRTFLEGHPNEVIIVVVEDHTPADETAAVFAQSGLDAYAYTHRSGSPFPTLRQMIESNQRLLVMAENDGSGPDWYHAAFELVQDTPYSFASPEEFSAQPNRGLPDNPLYLLNHWIEKVTPSPGDADEVNRYEVLLRRGLEFEQVRKHIPNLVAINFYDRGDLLLVVDTLNGVERPRP